MTLKPSHISILVNDDSYTAFDTNKKDNFKVSEILCNEVFSGKEISFNEENFIEI